MGGNCNSFINLFEITNILVKRTSSAFKVKLPTVKFFIEKSNSETLRYSQVNIGNTKNKKWFLCLPSLSYQLPPATPSFTGIT